MSEPTAPGPDLQFERAEFAGEEQGTACTACSQAIVDQFYETNGKLLCTSCREAVVAAFTGGSGTRRWIRAWLFGSAGGVVGAILYFGVTRITGWNIGLVALVVGFLVGAGVRKGSDERGGLAYQLLALMLAYLSIGLSLAPDVYTALVAEQAEAGLLLYLVTVITSIVAPVLVGIEAPISGLIFAFALYEAFRRNKKVELALTGPYPVQPQAEGAESAEQPGAAVVG